MTKSELRSGMEVTLRNGETGIISDNVKLINLDKGGCYELFYYDDELTRDSKYGNLDIVLITWKREDIKEITMKDIEEKFGCKVKIVG